RGAPLAGGMPRHAVEAGTVNGAPAAHPLAGGRCRQVGDMPPAALVEAVVAGARDRGGPHGLRGRMRDRGDRLLHRMVTAVAESKTAWAVAGAMTEHASVASVAVKPKRCRRRETGCLTPACITPGYSQRTSRPHRAHGNQSAFR